MSKLGLEMRTYLNTGAMATPTWSEVELVRDETINLSKTLVDVTTRKSGGWRLQRGALKEASVDFSLLYVPGDEDFETFRDAFLDDSTQVIMGFFDGDVTASGTHTGLHAAFNVTAFGQPRNLEDAVIVEVTVVPDLEAVTLTAPTWQSITVS